MASNIRRPESRLVSWNDFWSCSPLGTSACEGGTSLDVQSCLHASVLSPWECPFLINSYHCLSWSPPEEDLPLYDRLLPQQDLQALLTDRACLILAIE